MDVGDAVGGKEAATAFVSADRTTVTAFTRGD